MKMINMDVERHNMLLLCGDFCTVCGAAMAEGGEKRALM